MREALKAIDIDVHLMEPYDLWERNLPEPYRARTRIESGRAQGEIASATRVEIDGKGAPVPARLPITQRHSLHRYRQEPLMRRAAEECTPEVYLEAMDVQGIEVAVLVPTHLIPALRHDHMQPDHALALCKVYNDWACEFSRANPERLKFWGYLPSHDAQLAVQEAGRCVEQLGAAGVALSQGAINGHLFCDEFFDPLWERVVSLDAPLGVHVAFGGMPEDDFHRRYAGHRRAEVLGNAMTLGGHFAQTAVAEFILGGVLERFPKLKLVIMESCASWLPYLLWRLEEKWETYGAYADVDFNLSLTPREYFQRQCYAGMECEEYVAKYVIDYLGDDNLFASTDFPHHDAPFPNGFEVLLGLEGISTQSKQKILRDNAAKLFGLETKTAEQATVAA